MRIVEFKAENIARIKAVEITPDTGKNIVALTGKNRQGKTTILNAIWMALGGKDLSLGRVNVRGTGLGKFVI